MEIVPWADQQQRLVSALSAGGLPDVSMLGNNVVAQFVAAGSLSPVEIALVILGTQMLPSVAVLVPLVVIIRQIGLSNTLTALIFTHLSLGMPIAVWMLRRGSFRLAPRFRAPRRRPPRPSAR